MNWTNVFKGIAEFHVGTEYRCDCGTKEWSPANISALTPGRARLTIAGTPLTFGGLCLGANPVNFATLLTRGRLPPLQHPPSFYFTPVTTTPKACYLL